MPAPDGYEEPQNPKSCQQRCGRPMPPKPTPEQVKAFMEMQKRALEMRKAFQKDTKHLTKKSRKVFNSMLKCKKCKESKYKFVPCDKHLEKLKVLGEAMQKIQMYYGLKRQFEQFRQAQK